jgi:hypothetical protein
VNFSAIPQAARNEALSAPIALPVLAAPVAPELVRAATDRFRCGPYACVLSAAACKARRGAAGEQVGQWSKGARPGTAPLSTASAKFRPKSASPGWKSGDYGLCRGCPVGEQIAQQISN